MTIGVGRNQAQRYPVVQSLAVAPTLMRSLELDEAVGLSVCLERLPDKKELWLALNHCLATAQMRQILLVTLAGGCSLSPIENLTLSGVVFVHPRATTLPRSLNPLTLPRTPPPSLLPGLGSDHPLVMSPAQPLNLQIFHQLPVLVSPSHRQHILMSDVFMSPC